MTDDSNINCKNLKLPEPEFDNSLINKLNDDCFREIFSYLTIADILHVEKVCKRWEGLCQESWKAVESLKCEYGICYLMGKYFDRQLYRPTCANDLWKCLQSCGKFIKYFRVRIRHTYHRAIFSSLLIKVPHLCENLQEIKIDSSYSPSAIDIRSIANSCEHLERFTLTRIDEEWERDLSELLSNNKKLKYFSLGRFRDFDRMTGRFLQYLPANVIEEIRLINCRRLEPVSFITAMKQFSNLRSFTFESDGDFNDSMMKIIGQKKTLIKLSISDAFLTVPKSFYYLGNLTNLETLNVSRNDKLQDDALINISNNCKQLKLLDISCCRLITNRGIASVAKLKQLKYFVMNGLVDVTDEPIGNLSDTLVMLQCFHCKKVKDDGVMRLIRKAPNLTLLYLNLCLITNNTIETAIDVTSKRTNNIVLTMRVESAKINLSEITKRSPFLRIVDCLYK